MPVLSDLAHQRLTQCSGCEQFRHLTKQCAICHCVMPVKVWLKSAKCPLGLWREVVSNEQ